MSRQSNGVDISLLAAADYSATGQYCAGMVNASGQFVKASVAGQTCIGILQNNPGAGQAAAVRVSGVSKIICGNTVAAGTLVKADNAGKAVPAALGTTNTSDAGAANDALIGSDVLGIALTGGVAGDIIALLVEPRGAVATTAA
jgi:hypothetical protein